MAQADIAKAAKLDSFHDSASIREHPPLGGRVLEQATPVSNRETGIPCFPTPADSGNGGNQDNPRAFPGQGNPHVPTKSGIGNSASG